MLNRTEENNMLFGPPEEEDIFDNRDDEEYDDSSWSEYDNDESVSINDEAYEQEMDCE